MGDRVSGEDYYTEDIGGKRRLDSSSIYMQRVRAISMLDKEGEQNIGKKIECSVAGIVSIVYNYQNSDGEKKGMELMLEELRFSTAEDELVRKSDVTKEAYGTFLKLTEFTKGVVEQELHKGVEKDLLELCCYGLSRKFIRSTGNRLAAYLDLEASKTKRVSKKELITNLRRELKTYLFHEKKTRDELVEGCLRLAADIARKEQTKNIYFIHFMDHMDLVQHANIGLMKAVDKFDYRRGHKFSSMAVWWIRQEVTRAIAREETSVRLPLNFVRIKSGYKNLSDKDIKTLEEKAEELDIPVEQLQEILMAPQVRNSLDQPIGDTENLHLMDLIPNPRAISPEKNYQKSELRERVEGLLTALTPTEKEILQLRYGFGNDKDLPLRKVGEKFSLSGEMIRRIQKKAESKIREEGLFEY